MVEVGLDDLTAWPNWCLAGLSSKLSSGVLFIF